MTEFREIGTPRGNSGSANGGPKGDKKQLLALAGVALGGLLIYKVLRGRKAAQDANAYAGDTGIAVPQTQGVSGSAYGGGSGVPGAPAPTNASWAQGAITYLESLGYDPQFVSHAIGSYLSGDGLTNDQLGVVQTALATQGNLPGGTLLPHLAAPSGQQAPTSVTNPVPAAPAPAPRPRTFTATAEENARGYDLYRVLDGETWDSLAERFYGEANNATALVNYNNQRGITDPSLSAGRIIYIPVAGRVN